VEGVVEGVLSFTPNRSLVGLLSINPRSSVFHLAAWQSGFIFGKIAFL
jgi:hypothetical protein